MTSVSDERLQNWARWLRYGSGNHGRALSYEGNFRARENWNDPRNARPITPDEQDAREVELACALLPIRSHIVLKLRRVFVWSPEDCAEFMRKQLKLRLDGAGVEAEEITALCLLAEALEMPAVVRKQRAQAIIRRLLAACPLTAAEAIAYDSR